MQQTVQRVIALVAIIFGLATVAAGTRVLMGTSPGYEVFQPLLMFNTLMGFAYIAAGLVAWRSRFRGLNSALGILLINLVVFVAVVIVYTTSTGVATESIMAMAFRSGVWLVLVLALYWLVRSQTRSQPA